MKVIIFYSWQTDTPIGENLGFIEDALNIAIKKFKNYPQYKDYEIVVQRDARGIPGTPSIPNSIESRVDVCQIFLADFTITNLIGIKKESWLRRKMNWLGIPNNNQLQNVKPQPNGNVLIEYGQAFQRLGDERVILVMNEAYGIASEENMLFDVRQRRWPIRYNYTQKDRDNKKKILENFSVELFNKLRESIDFGVKNPLWEYFPFFNLERWKEMMPNRIDFVPSENLTQKINTIINIATAEKSVLRIVGLSGLGKTRLVYEALASIKQDAFNKVKNRILYLDLNDKLGEYKEVILRLSESSEQYIIVLDNCDVTTHNDVQKIVEKSRSKLSLISMDYNPLTNSLERSTFPNLLELLQDDYEPIIDGILNKYFPGPDQENERSVIKKFANGHTLVATILAVSRLEIKKGEVWHPIINRTELLNKLLGNDTTEDSKGILRSVSIFERLGYFEELKNESNLIAQSHLFLKKEIMNSELAINNYREICNKYLQRGVIEKQARYIRIRTIPIALSLAVEWWEHCDADFAKQIFDSLTEYQGLREALVEQLKYLDFLENARDIIENFVSPTGPFGKAEVLNTSEGSRLFRSFVEVNPIACVETLERELGFLETKGLLLFKAGRRNIVWALEKLSFRRETFHKSAIILAHLSIAETEAISNNSRGQFLQLFHIFLAGTQATLEQRKDIIDYLLKRKSPEWNELILATLSSALKTESFMRMGGAEKQGSSNDLKDYRPSINEVKEYWEYCFRQLFMFIDSRDNERLSDSAAKTILNSLRGIIHLTFSSLAVPNIERIAQVKPKLWMDIIRTINGILRFEGKFLTEPEYIKLKRILEDLAPKSFADRYTSQIKTPTWADYTSDVDYAKKIKENSTELAKEFISEGCPVNLYTELFFTAPQHYGYYFGEAVARQIADSPTRRNAFNLFIDSLLTVQENIELNVIAGFMYGLQESEKLECYTQLINHTSLLVYAFPIASMINPNKQIIDLLFDLVEKGVFDPNEFMRFHSVTLSNLDETEFLMVIQRLIKLGIQGVKVALQLLYTHSLNDESIQTRDLFKTILAYKGLLTDDSGTMQDHYWKASVLKILTEEHDVEFAKHIASEIVDYCSTSDLVSSVDFRFYDVFKILFSNYFADIWEIVADGLLSDNYMTYFNLKNILGSQINGFGNENGTLFNFGDQDKLLQLIESKGPIAIKRIIGMAPIFSDSSPNDWYPLTLTLINRYGNLEGFLSELSANLGTFGWTGTIVPLLESKRILMEKLKNHPIKEVREWAHRYLLNLDQEIRREANEDIERYL